MSDQSPLSASKSRNAALSLQMRSHGEELNIFTVVNVMWRNRWTLSICVLVAILIGGYYAFAVATPHYASTSSLALKLRNEQVVDIDSVLSGVSSDWMALNTELEVIQSRALIKQLVHDLDLTQDPEFNSKLRPKQGFSINKLRGAIRSAILGLLSGDDGDTPEQETSRLSEEEETLNDTISSVRGRVSTSQIRDTYIFNISFTSNDPLKAATISNALAQVYIRDQINQKYQATENAVAWLSERVVDLRAELEEKQNTVKSLRASLDLGSPEEIDAINRQARTLRDRLDLARAEAERLRTRREELLQARDTGDVDAILSLARDPIMNRLQGQMDNGDPQARELFFTRLDTLISQVETDLSRSERQEEAMADSLGKIEEQISAQSEKLIELEQLERDTAATETLYDTFLTRLKETSVQRGLQQADSRLLSEATPGTPVAPRRSRIVMMSAILGFLFGAMIVALRQFQHSGFRSATELEKATGMPIIGQIPRFPLRRRRDLIPYMKDKPTSAAAEAIRNLRTAITLSNVDAPPKVILVTSSEPGEGKTTQAVSLALNMVDLNKRVLLIEGDIRRRTFHEYFELPSKPAGIISAMTTDMSLDDIIIRDSRTGIDLLVGEKTNINAADVFASERFHDLMDTLRERYDFIVIDTPPVLIVPDALVIGQLADCIVMNVAWDRTGRGEVLETLRQMETVNLSPSGIVMSRIDARGMKRYGYGSYYKAYASKYYNN